MAISTGIKAAAGIVSSVGVIGGGALALDTRHAPMSVVSELGVMQIFELVKSGQQDGKSDWICNAIEKEIIRLCSKEKDHYLCGPDGEDAVKDLKRKANCEEE